VVFCYRNTFLKNYYSVTINIGKAFVKIQHSFLIKNSKKLGIKGTYLNIIRIMYDKPIAIIVLNRE
jgi:hypothetical protein